MTEFSDLLFCLILTISTYLLSFLLYQKWLKPWLNPLFTASTLLVVLLFLFQVPVDTYRDTSSLFSHLLQLAVVSLAVPLYKQWGLVKKNYKKIITGVLAGTTFGVLAVVVLAHFFHLQQQLLASLIPRSVTIPVALTISNELGGMNSITILFVVISALMSVWIGPKLFIHLGIHSKSAKGLAMGTSAQMIGANHSLFWGEEEGAMGSVAMTISPLMLSLGLPLLTVFI